LWKGKWENEKKFHETKLNTLKSQKRGHINSSDKVEEAAGENLCRGQSGGGKEEKAKRKVLILGKEDRKKTHKPDETRRGKPRTKKNSGGEREKKGGERKKKKTLTKGTRKSARSVAEHA